MNRTAASVAPAAEPTCVLLINPAARSAALPALHILLLAPLGWRAGTRRWPLPLGWRCWLLLLRPGLLLASPMAPLAEPCSTELALLLA